MGGRAGGGAAGGMGSRSRNSDGRFVGTGGEVFYNGPGSKGWNESVAKALKAGTASNKDSIYLDFRVESDQAYTVMAGVAAKSTGFQKDIATKGLKKYFDSGKTFGLSEKQAWAVSYEFKRLFGN